MKLKSFILRVFSRLGWRLALLEHGNRMVNACKQLGTNSINFFFFFTKLLQLWVHLVIALVTKMRQLESFGNPLYFMGLFKIILGVSWGQLGQYLGAVFFNSPSHFQYPKGKWSLFGWTVSWTSNSKQLQFTIPFVCENGECQ